jgi:hypothetical protein
LKREKQAMTTQITPELQQYIDGKYGHNPALHALVMRKPKLAAQSMRMNMALDAFENAVIQGKSESEALEPIKSLFAKPVTPKTPRQLALAARIRPFKG